MRAEPSPLSAIIHQIRTLCERGWVLEAELTYHFCYLTLRYVLTDDTHDEKTTLLAQTLPLAKALKSLGEKARVLHLYRLAYHLAQTNADTFSEDISIFKKKLRGEPLDIALSPDTTPLQIGNLSTQGGTTLDTEFSGVNTRENSAIELSIDPLIHRILQYNAEFAAYVVCARPRALRNPATTKRLLQEGHAADHDDHQALIVQRYFCHELLWAALRADISNVKGTQVGAQLKALLFDDPHLWIATYDRGE